MSVYILSSSRTPQGAFNGNLSSVKSTALGSIAIKGALEKLKDQKVDEVIMGQVIQAGVGQAPARQAALGADLPNSTPCVTVNKVCGSGMQAIIDGAKSILCDDAKLIVAGGMESMSQAPHFTHLRGGTKFGTNEIKDSLMMDGLWDVYSNRLMGSCAEECAGKYNFTRQEQDDFAISSFKKAQAAQEAGVFKNEITPVLVKNRKSETLIENDESPFNANFEKIPKLRAAFDKEGTITAANASSMNDGAAAVVLASSEYKDQAKFEILSWARHAQDPTWFTTAPVEAMKKNLEKQSLSINDIDLFEINEAFAVVTMAAIKELDIPEEKVNIYGSGISLGHPLGVSGARILITLMNGLEQKNKTLGMASLCIGGGEALSMIIKRL